MFPAEVSIQKDPKMLEQSRAEAEFVSSQREAGRIRAIYLSPDKTLSWHVIDVENEDAATALLKRYPYAPWFCVRTIQRVTVVP
ncbi:MAG: hypothetical protein B7733_02065 [Myxococcales bacterium FL481]|nr:MAG: hypothetical protein B7733_02065 [Myxococcales bacterium FL481]